MSVAYEDEVRIEVARHLDGAKETGGNAAVSLPRHAPVERFDRVRERRIIVADLDRFEQQKGTSLGKDAERKSRTARQVSNEISQDSLDVLEPGDRLASRCVITRVHASGDIDDDQRVEALPHRFGGRRDQRDERQ